MRRSRTRRGNPIRIESVAVTGAAGLIGSAVARRLAERGARVLAVDDFSIGAWKGEHPNILWKKVDVRSPGALAGESFDALVHCAAHPGGKSLSEPVLDVEVNALGSMRLFELCARTKTPVVYLSSSAVYGEQPEGPIPEAAELKPGTVYAACKQACEHFLRILGEGYGLPWTVLRLFATYGAGHKPSLHQGILNVMLTQLSAGDRVVVKGSLARTRDLLYVDDAAEAIVAAVFAEKARERTLNVGTGTSVTVRGLIEAVCRALGKDASRVEIVEEPGTVGDPMHSVADVSRAYALLGWSAKTSLEQGLGELLRRRNEIASAAR